MLLLHGLGDCARSWDRLASTMSAEHHVVALDVRGHGDSEWAAPAYGLAHLVSDVEALVGLLGLERIVLVGHGSGAAQAIAYAGRHPQLVHALVAVESDVTAAPPGSRSVLGQTKDAGDEWDSLSAVKEYLRGLQPNATDASLTHQARHLTRELPSEGRRWKRDPAAAAAFEQPDLWKEWAGLQCPVLVARGRQSTALSHDSAVRMREAAATARLAELEGGGHWFHQEIPGDFEATVRWFLDSPPL
jgi:pimeloyl-ACP methyl ester carboxylesterase